MSNRYYSRNDSDDLAKGLMITFGVVLGLAFVAAFFIYAVWASAFVGMKLWAWFVIPFALKCGVTLPPLTFGFAWGLSLFVSYWTYHHKTIPIKDERETKDKVLEVFGLLAYPWLVLFFGWIAQHWVS